MVGIHERAEVSEPCGELWEGMEAEPGYEETGTDEGLKEQAEIGEPMLPAGILGPGRMLRSSHRSWERLA